jgi:hypothetical protein
MEPASSIIKKLGGEAKVSEITGTAYTAPYRWQRPKNKGGTGGLIPQGHHPILLSYAQANGIDLVATDFLPPAPATAPADEDIVAPCEGPVMTVCAVKLFFDQEALAWLTELTARLSDLGELVPRPVEIVELVRSIPHTASAFDLKSLPTGRANEHRIVLEPSHALLGLMSALRALDGDRHFVNEARHIQSPRLGSTSMVTESPPGQKPGGDQAGDVS